MTTERKLADLDNPVGEPFFSRWPETVGIAINGYCNLKCRHCFNLSGPDIQQELPLRIIEGILAEMRAWGVRKLRITGGEPTLHQQFREIIAACQHDGVSVAVNTNGIYSPPLLAYLKTAPIAMFLVSIDGLAATNDAIRGKGTFSIALGACRELKEAGQQVMISMHVRKGNKHDVPGLVQIASEACIDVKISPLRPIGRARDELPGEFMLPDDHYHVVQQITRFRKQCPQIKILTDFDILDKSIPNNDCRHISNETSCKAGRTMVNVNYDGRIYPCGFFHTEQGEFSAGNVYQDSIRDVWQKARVFQAFRILRKSNRCQTCIYYPTRCNGGCPAIAYFTTGRLDAHDPTCFVDLIPPHSGTVL